MATVESWVLSGLDISSGNFQILELVADPPKRRMEWISGPDSEDSELPNQPLHENRVITMKLRIAPQASMDAALDQVGLLLDKLYMASATVDGIPLVWTPANSARARTFDVVSGEITELPIGLEGHARSWFAQRPIFTVELTCKPYWRGAEVTTSTASGTTPLVSLEIANVPGDVPALGRLIVTDTATQTRRYVEWGLEWDNYVSPGASLQVNSASLVTSGFSGVSGTRSGSLNANTINATLWGNIPSAVVGTGSLAHVGVYRVKARVWASNNNENIAIRLVWQVGDGPFLANDYTHPVAIAGWSEIDLGAVNVPPAITGTQRWTGKIEAYSLTTGETISVDYLLLIPASNGYGRIRAVTQYTSSGVIVGADEFIGTTSGGALNARVAPAGGTWATSGATTDFLFSDLPVPHETVQRATTADTGAGRFAILGTSNYTDITNKARVQTTGGGTLQMGVIARYVDSSNYAHAYINWATSALVLRVVVAGVATQLGSDVQYLLGNAFYEVYLTIGANGRVIATLTDGATNPLQTISSFHSSLATGGALATGKVGLLDFGSTAAGTRYYEWIFASTPPTEQVAIYSGRNLQVRHDDTIRQDSAGTYYGRPPSYRGTRLVIPPGTSRIVAKAHRNDLEFAEHTPLGDALQIQAAYTPRGIAVPR